MSCVLSAELVFGAARGSSDRGPLSRPSSGQGGGGCCSGARETELTAEERRLANFVDFIGEGRGSQALAKALVETERRVDQLRGEVEALRRSREKIFRPPPIEWIKDRLNNIQQVLEQRTARSAQTLRSLLGPIRLDLVTPDIGRPFYRAVTTLDALALTEEPPPAGAEDGSNSLQRWDSFQMLHGAGFPLLGDTFVQLPGALCASRPSRATPALWPLHAAGRSRAEPNSAGPVARVLQYVHDAFNHAARASQLQRRNHAWP